MAVLVNGLGGTSGFGENFLARNDDGSTTFINLQQVFGQGLNFFGTVYDGLYLNNNGSVTFGNATGSYTPTSISGNTNNPMIAAFWADVDTRGPAGGVTPGGNSTGTNLLWYDLDSVNHTFTATWDDVGYYSGQTNKLNAFQIRLVEVAGGFDIELRYEDVNWTTGGASGGSNGLGGTPARAGYTSGNGFNFFELPQSGNQNALLDLETASNVGDPGVYRFSVRDGAATVALSPTDTTVSEGNGTPVRYAIVTVNLAAPSANPVTVNYATANGTAIAGSDYVSQRGTLTFAPGVLQQNIFVEIIGNTVPEAAETFSVLLSGATGAQIADAEAIVTIANDDGLAISDVRMLEGTGASPTPFVFTVTLLSAATAPVTVNYNVAPGTAAAGTDYAATNGTLTFAAGETTKTVTVNVVADSVKEADETFNVVLSGASGAPISDATGVGTILNDDGLVVDDIRVVEGTAATTVNVPVTVRLLSPAPTNVTFAWTTVPGTATAPADFTSVSGNATILAGATSVTVLVPVVRDSLVESSHSFEVVISNAVGAAIVDARGTVTIADDDGFVVSDLTLVEGSSATGTTSANFVVTLQSALTTAATVNYATVDGTATAAGHDYVHQAGTLTFAPGETSKTVTVAVGRDFTSESNETFSLVLSNPSANAGINDGTGQALITNDDGLSVGNASITEGNAGTSNVGVTISLSAAAATPVSVNWATANGTAVAVSDFVAQSGTVTFAAGETSKTVQVAVVGDTNWEPTETFRVVLSNPTGSSIVDGSGTITVFDNDVRPPPALSVSNASITEGTGAGITIMRFVVGLSYAATSTVTVAYATTNGTATAGSDYTATHGTLTIPAGSLFGIVEVPVTREALVEGNETLTLTLSSPTGGVTIDDGTAIGTIVNDDARLSIAATSASKAEGQSGSTPFTFTVTRTGDTGVAHTADWAVTGTGASPANAADFTGGVLPSGAVSFAAGQTSKIITVNVAGNTLVEANDDFTVTLSNPSAGAALGTASATGSIVNDDPVDDFAGNSTTTGLVVVGGTATGNLETAGDADWFRVIMTADTTYSVRLDGATVGAGTLADPFVYLHNGAGTLLASNDDSGGADNSLLVFTPTVTGTFYISARDFGDNSTGTYRVGVTESADSLSGAVGEADGNIVVDPATQALFQQFFNTYWDDFHFMGAL
jgi:DNA-binding cell septation regulator SpoVG